LQQFRGVQVGLYLGDYPAVVVYDLELAKQLFRYFREILLSLFRSQITPTPPNAISPPLDTLSNIQR
jgi:hypothetical protein